MTRDRIVELLISAGANKSEAKVLIFLYENAEATQRQIEVNMNMRQPEVSRALSSLVEKGIVKFRQVKKVGRGRPVKVYSLNRDFKEIVKSYIDAKRKELEQIKRDLEELESYT